MKEMHNIQSAKWYLKEQLDIDKKMVIARYNAIKKYFKGITCLEIGPAEGIMTNLLINDFKELDVVDASQSLLDKIKNKKNLRKFHSYIEHFKPDKKYDTIIMDHILEHVKYPIKVLKRVKKWISNNGVLIIGVPNANSIHRLAAVKMGLLKNKYELNSRDKKLGHYRVYDFNKLENHILAAGLKIIKSGGILIKPLSYAQMQEQWDDKIIDAFIELGKDLPEFAAEIFIVTTLK